MARWLDQEEQERRFPVIKRINSNRDHRGRDYLMVNCLWEKDDLTVELHCEPLKGRVEDVVARIQSTKP